MFLVQRLVPFFLFLSSSFSASSLPAVPRSPQAAGHAEAQSEGVFKGSNDIGTTLVGSSHYEPSAGTYVVSGGGEDVWGTADDFRFTWTRLTGDGALAADVHVNAPVTHRLSKGMLMFRQSLDPGSPYADIAMHADGHITLQYRQVQGGETKDVTLPEHNVGHLRIVRRGNTFTVSAQEQGARKGGGPSITIPMPATVYVGLGVCSHNTTALQSVTFGGVKLEGSQP